MSSAAATSSDNNGGLRSLVFVCLQMGGQYTFKYRKNGILALISLQKNNEISEPVLSSGFPVLHHQIHQRGDSLYQDYEIHYVDLQYRRSPRIFYWRSCQ